MNEAEKILMLNTERRLLMDLPPVVQHLMQGNIQHLSVLTTSGLWCACDESLPLSQWRIYTTSTSACIDPPVPVQYKQYPVFAGSADRIYKADLTQPNSDSKRIYHLTTAIGMAEFGGIRYMGSQEWRSTLNTMEYGVPVEVRLRVRAI